MKTIFVAVAAAVAVAAPAHAESFNGPFVGVSVSRDAYEVKAEDVVIDTDTDTVSADGISANGAAFGIYAGYDFKVTPTFFVGVEANGGISDASMSISASDLVSAKVSADETYGVSARFGGVVTSNTGLYARVGWQNTKLKAKITSGEDTLGASDWEDAFVYGGGLETALTSNFTIRAEYVVEDYGSAGLNEAADINGIHVDNYKASVGLSYRF